MPTTTAVAEKTETPQAKPFTPVRFYLSNPFRNERIYVDNMRRSIKFRNGTTLAESPEDVETIKASLPGQVYEEDFHPGEETYMCPVCGYHIRSNKAIRAHQAEHPFNQ